MLHIVRHMTSKNFSLIALMFFQRQCSKEPNLMFSTFPYHIYRKRNALAGPVVADHDVALSFSTLFSIDWSNRFMLGRWEVTCADKVEQAVTAIWCVLAEKNAKIPHYHEMEPMMKSYVAWWFATCNVENVAVMAEST